MYNSSFGSLPYAEDDNELVLLKKGLSHSFGHFKQIMTTNENLSHWKTNNFHLQVHFHMTSCYYLSVNLTLENS